MLSKLSSHQSGWVRNLALGALTLGLLASSLAAVPGSVSAQAAATLTPTPTPGAVTPLPPGSASVFNVAAANRQLGTLTTAIRTAGLVDALNAVGPFTLYAPTDAAFAKLPAGTLDNLLRNPDQLRTILLYHVVPGRFTGGQVVGRRNPLPTLQGASIAISVRGGATILNGSAQVGDTDLAAINGLVHLIDTVLIPPATAVPGATAVAPSATTTYVVQAGDNLIRLARRFNTTVEAIKRANALTSDVIQIGQRLIIPGAAPVTPVPAVSGMPAPAATAIGNTLPTVATGNAQFSTLVSLLQTAGLVDALNAAGPFTVYAPTNDAFNRLPAGTLDALRADPARLRAVLLYHVVPGRFTGAQVVGRRDPLPTLQGQTISISTRGGLTILNGTANVGATDISASNGLIHAIDTVLLPR